MKIDHVLFKECERTKAEVCECSTLNTLSEAGEAINAVAELVHSDTVKGTIKFTQDQGNPTVITGTITGLTPGEHGFHVHEFGDLSDGCDSAGAHFNPEGVEHGDLQEGHVGDMGNVTANEDGVAQINITAPRISLSGEQSIVGRAIVIHSDKDDLGMGGDAESIKTGNAGERAACGVIVLS